MQNCQKKTSPPADSDDEVDERNETTDNNEDVGDVDNTDKNNESNEENNQCDKENNRDIEASKIDMEKDEQLPPVDWTWKGYLVWYLHGSMVPKENQLLNFCPGKFVLYIYIST